MLAGLVAVTGASKVIWCLGGQPADGSNDERDLGGGVTVNWRNRTNFNMPPRSMFDGEDWRMGARCFMGGTGIFFDSDDADGPQLKPTVLARAQALCRGCEVARQCLTNALERDERYGVWAGASGRQRAKMKTRISAGESVEAVVSQWLAKL